VPHQPRYDEDQQGNDSKYTNERGATSTSTRKTAAGKAASTADETATSATGSQAGTSTGSKTGASTNPCIETEDAIAPVIPGRRRLLYTKRR